MMKRIEFVLWMIVIALIALGIHASRIADSRSDVYITVQCEERTCTFSQDDP